MKIRKNFENAATRTLDLVKIAVEELSSVVERNLTIQERIFDINFFRFFLSRMIVKERCD